MLQQLGDGLRPFETMVVSPRIQVRSGAPPSWRLASLSSKQFLKEELGIARKVAISAGGFAGGSILTGVAEGGCSGATMKLEGLERKPDWAEGS